MNFDNDPVGICREVLRVVKHWMSHGVRIFRVDNPHTKPVAFWEWLLKEIRRTDPDVLFLSEAFTRPAMMHGLGAVGFHQSYTYFTWRNAKWELEEYLREVSRESDHTMRPNFFVNTPDILHAYLQYGGPAAFKIRAAHRRHRLARAGASTPATSCSSTWRSARAARSTSTREKYQIRVRDWDGADGRGPHARAVPHPAQRDPPRAPGPAAAAQHRDPQQRRRERPGLLQAAALPDGQSDTVIIVVNLDPHATRETTVHLDLPALGLDWGDTLRGPRRDHRRRTGAGASTTTCGSTPATSRPTS